MILKTYARVFTKDLTASLAFFEQLIGRGADLRLMSGELELAAIGDILLFCGPEEALAPLRHGYGPLIVDDLAQTQALLEQAGAVITHPLTPTPTGTMLYARHPDGNLVEYMQWLPELVQRIIG
jgi:predicted enzyme related to lactoylglutathione lyase